MTDRPIIFSAPMVRALLEGRKTQTRRIAKFITQQSNGLWQASNAHGGCANVAEHQVADWAVEYASFEAGDRLYVREAARGEELPDGLDGVRYRADDTFRAIDNDVAASSRWLALHTYRGHSGSLVGPWVPPIHMPRWASRLTLLVDAVRCQRLHDIDELDAIAEGVRRIGAEYGAGSRPTSFDDGPNLWTVNVDGWAISAPAARETFKLLWQWLHGEESWASNPWIVAVTFRVVHVNIDAIR